MSISELFTRKATAPVAAPVEDSDKGYREAWGLSLPAWLALTEAERRDCRDRVVYAPYFGK